MILEIVHIGVLLVQASLGAMLLMAGAAKLADPRSFARTLLELGIPASWSLVIKLLPFIVPVFEVILGIAAISNVWPSLVDIVLPILMWSFTGVVLFALQRSDPVQCRCFGALNDRQFTRWTLLRSLGLSIGATLLFIADQTTARLEPNGSIGNFLLVIFGSVILGLAAAQAARTIALVKERMA
jgi:hypothetical protein